MQLPSANRILHNLWVQFLGLAFFEIGIGIPGKGIRDRLRSRSRHFFWRRLPFQPDGMCRAKGIWHELRSPKIGSSHEDDNMRKFLLGLAAVAAVFLPMSQSAQAHWVYYHHYYGRHFWHHGYWYAGCWHPGYWSWYRGPVVVVDPY